MRQETLREQLMASGLLAAIRQEESNLDMLYKAAGRCRTESALRRIQVRANICGQKLHSHFKKLAKVLPDLKAHDVEAKHYLMEVTHQDKIEAVLYGIPVSEFVELKREGRLPPPPPLPSRNVYPIVGPSRAPKENQTGIQRILEKALAPE